ncbi:hypothetical protein, partial [Escherichia coli]
VPAYVPISWVIQDNRFLFALPCRSYPPGQKCIIGKNVQIFFLVIGIFVVGRTSASGHNCWHVQKNRCGD